MKRTLAGDRRVWLAAGAALFACLVGVVISLFVPRDLYLGTNAVAVQSLVATVPDRTWLCVPDLDVPDGAGRVRFGATWPAGPRPAFEAFVRAGGQERRGLLRRDDPEGKAEVSFRALRLDGGAARGEACIRPLGEAVKIGGRREVLGAHPLPTLGGRKLEREIAVWFLGPRGERRTLASALPDIARRAALFRPAPIGPWTYWLLLIAIPVVALLAVRLLAVRAADAGRTGATAVAVGATAFALAAAWALITPPLDAPDEPEHYAYTQSLVERGEPPEKGGGRLPPYSGELVAAIEGMRLYARVQSPDERPFWRKAREREVERRLAGRAARTDSGGGYLTSTSTHSPAYYSLSTLGYLAGSGGGFFAKLTLMRLVSALLTALVAALAFLTVRELMPGHPWAAVAAGLLVAFQPMFGFIGGSVNNDAGVNAAAATLIYLLVRGLRRGLSLPLGLAIGAMLAITPLMKGTGYALVPAALVAMAGMLWRRHAVRDLARIAGVVVAAAAAQGIWGRVAAGFDRSVYTTPGGGAPTAGVQAVLRDPLTYAEYLWQTFLPRLPFMNDVHGQRWPAYDIYVERGFAAFGWYAHQLPRFVYGTIALTLIALVVLGLIALVRERVAAVRLGWELATLLIAVAGVIGGVAAAYFTDEFRGVVAEQGRYAFTAIVPLAALAVGACFGLGRRLAPVGAGLLVGAMAGLACASQVLALSRFFS